MHISSGEVCPRPRLGSSRARTTVIFSPIPDLKSPRPLFPWQAPTRWRVRAIHSPTPDLPHLHGSTRSAAPKLIQCPRPDVPPISLCDPNLMEAVLMGKGEAERKKRSGDERASGPMPPNPSRRSPSVLPLRLPHAPLCLLLDHHHHGMFKAQLEAPCTTCFQVGRWWAMVPTKILPWSRP